MKKFLSALLICILLLTFWVFALGSGEDDETVSEQAGTVTDTDNNNVTETEKEPDNALGDYIIEIKECRLAKDFEKKPVVIVTYSFTNQEDDSAASFAAAIEENVYQNGVGLNECYFLDDSYNYNGENATKEIKKGATIDVDVAYVLNDETTPIDVEVKELFSFSDKVITRQFELK